MKKHRWKLFIVCAAVAALLLCAIKFFPAETHAVVWHVRHGSHIDVHNIAFRVPLFYDAEGEENGLKISRGAAGGGWKFGKGAYRKYELILMIFAGGEPLNKVPNDWNKRGALAGPRKMGLMRTGERSMRLAGRDGSCMEYGGRPQAIDRIESRDDVEVDCWFGNDVIATFLGSRKSQQVFYEIIQSAQNVGGKS